MNEPGRLENFEAVRADKDFPSVVFQRLTAEEPETLREIAASLNLPRGKFVEWFTTEHAGLYDAALKCRADELVHDALVKADEASDRDTAAAAKVKVDTRLKVASKWDRAKYGDSDDRARSGPLVVFQIANLREAPKVEVLPVSQAGSLPETVVPVVSVGGATL